jgi:hypothetical protein
MNEYKIRANNVSHIEIMRRIRRAGGRCLRFIPGHKVNIVLTDIPVNMVGLERTIDDDIREREYYERQKEKSTY